VISKPVLGPALIAPPNFGFFVPVLLVLIMDLTIIELQGTVFQDSTPGKGVCQTYFKKPKEF
jgi:hypothetical protein